MEIRPLPAEEAAVRRYVEELWLPYNRDLEAVVEGFELAEDVDIVDEEIEFRMDRLDDAEYRAWVAIDGGPDGDSNVETDLADVDGELVGFVTTEIDEAPSVFARPDRLIVGDIYVAESYRGSGLAEDLIGLTEERARQADCPEIALDVDVDNERALAFYEKLGFEPVRHRMTAPVDEL